MKTMANLQKNNSNRPTVMKSMILVKRISIILYRNIQMTRLRKNRSRKFLKLNKNNKRV